MRAIATSALACLLAACASAPPPSPAKPTPPPVVVKSWVLSGEKDLRVQVLLLEGKKEALVQISGVMSPIDNKVLHCQVVEKTPYRTAYETAYKGKQQAFLIKETKRFGNKPRWIVWAPPLYNRSFLLEYDAKATQALSSETLIALHLQQLQSGALAALARFDRQEAITESKKYLTHDFEQARERCGTEFSLDFPWESFSDDQLLENSVYTFCSAWLGQINSLCARSAARALFSRFQTLRCQPESKLALHPQGDTLVLSGPADRPAGNYNILQEMLVALKTPGGKSLAQALEVEATQVCLAKNDRAIAIGPAGAKHAGLSYGDKGTFYKVRTAGQSNAAFYDPRHLNPRANPSFRGVDWRYVSRVEVDDEAQTCTLHCGTRQIPLQLAEQAAAERVLASISYTPNPFQRWPHALARDQRGIYYYVDRALDEENQKNFRVYVGPRGSCRLQQMKDIVSDSEGQIFSTAQGKLKLILGKQEARWIGKVKQQKLLLLPIMANLELIFNQLGPYLGQRLGTPCDDF